MTDRDPSLLELDAAYRPFPSFQQWIHNREMDLGRWNRYTASIQRHSDPERLAQALGIATRAAAIDTGALENLYEADRGFTFTVAFEAASWELALEEKGTNVRPLFEAQLHAYEYVLDLATRLEPISEAAIRVLHEVVCKAQDTYRVMTAIGPQEQSLPKGQYKSLPNHVRTRRGEYHSYAPVDVTGLELARLVREVRTAEFENAHPVRQAAYVHYCFVLIHPFADGNGRVARALASMFTYRNISMPIVILTEHKTAYLDALESADAGNYEPFESFLLARSLDTIGLVNESLNNVSVAAAPTSAELINGLYTTKGGYTQDQVEDAGQTLFDLVFSAIDKQVKQIKTGKLSTQVLMNSSNPGQSSTHRAPIRQNKSFAYVFSTEQPASAHFASTHVLQIPKNAGGDDDLLITSISDPDSIGARMDELLPAPSGVLLMRIQMFAERRVSKAINHLVAMARKKLL